VSRTAADVYRNALSVAVLVVVTVLFACTIPAWSAPPADRLTAAEFLDQVKAGAAIDYTGLDIIGTVDLSSLHEVKQAIRCRDCQLDGDLIATDVTFAQSIDLEHVVISGRLDARGAVLDGPMLSRAGGRVGRDVDLSFAHFSQSSAFDGLSFMGAVSFEGAQFDGSASFTGTTFADSANFDRTRFAEGVDFGGGINGGAAHAKGDATFRLADFGGPADFGQRIFDKNLSLNHARADKTVSLADTRVEGSLTADGGVLNDVDAKKLFVKGSASLFSTQMHNLSLNAATIGCSLDLQSSTVTGRATLRDVSLQYIQQSKSTCTEPGQLLIDDFSAAQLSMDRRLVDNVVGDDAKHATLHNIETFERTSGSVSEANEAHFELLALDAKNKKGGAAFGDWIYRQIGGYLVRPLRPLRGLAVVIVLGAVLRWLAFNPFERREKKATPAGGVLLRSARTGVKFSGRFVVGILESLTAALSAAFRPKLQLDPIGTDPEAIDYGVGAAKLVEFLATKALLFAFVLCLANYNTTLHDLIKGLVPA
jgi:hypothetical protein